MQRRGTTSIEDIHMSDTNCNFKHLVLARLLVTNKVVMSLKLKLLSLVDAYARLKLIGSCKCDKGNTHAELMPLLGEIHIVDWPFQYLNSLIR